MFPLLALAALDVQIDGRLVRLEWRQGEYCALTLMLAPGEGGDSVPAVPDNAA